MGDQKGNIWELELIQIIRDTPMLYDRSDPDYQKKVLKDLEWKRIAQTLKADEKEIRTKWRNMRDQFFKLDKTQLSLDPEYRTATWRYYDPLTFLRDKAKIKDGNNKMPICKDADDEHTDEDYKPSDFEEKLITMVRKKPFLYDRSVPEYRINPRKEEAWREISKTLGISLTEIRKRWRSLRDHFFKLDRKFFESRRKFRTHIGWRYYDSMLFMRNHARRTKNKYESSVKFEDESMSASAEGDEDDTCPEFEFHCDSIGLGNCDAMDTSLLETTRQEDDILDNGSVLEVAKRAGKDLHDCLEILKKSTEIGPAERTFAAIGKQIDLLGLPANELLKLEHSVLETVNEIVGGTGNKF